MGRRSIKKESYILIIGIVTCGFITSPYVLNHSLVIRHVVWCITTMLLCACLFIKKRKNLAVLSTPIFLVFVGYCLMTTISVFKAANATEALYAILVSWVTLMFFVCIVSTVDKEIVIKSLVYLGLVLAGYGLYEIAKHNFNILGVTGLGFTTGKNKWSSTLMLLLPFSLYAIFKYKSKLAIIAAILLLVDMLFLQTRSVYLGLFVATVVTVFFYKKRVIIPVLIGVAICAFTFERLRNTGSLVSRFQLWDRTIRAFCDDPILGVGAGNWKIATPRYGNKVEFGETHGEMYHQRAHNDFLEVLTESGIIGGLCYAGIFVLAIYYSLRTRDKVLAWTMRFGIISYIVFASFSFPKELALHSIIIFTMIGLVVREYPMRKEWYLKRNIKTLVACIAIILLALFVNYHRHQTGVYCRKLMWAKANRNWKEVVRIIDENYTPFSTMLSYAVTPIYQYRAEANFYLQNHEEAYSDYLRAYELHPNHPAILFNIGYYKYIQRDFQGACEFYERAYEIYPDAEFTGPALARAKDALFRQNNWFMIPRRKL